MVLNAVYGAVVIQCVSTPIDTRGSDIMNRLEKLAYPIPSTRKKAGHYYIYLSILVER